MTTVSSLIDLAGMVRRIAVLIEAGVPPRSVWRYLAATPMTTSIDVRVRAGEAQAEAILGSVDSGVPDEWAWRTLAACLMIATRAGAPLAACLRDVASSFHATANVRRDVSTALTGPKATSRLVLALPLVGVVVSSLMGFDTIRILFATGAGLLCLVTGLVLLFVAQRWTCALVMRAQPQRAIPGLHLELMAMAVSGGGSLDRARGIAATAMARCGLEARYDAELAEVLELSRRAGVPAAELLRSAAVEARLAALANAQRGTAALAVALLLPVGLCILPAFIVLCVLPLLLAVVSSTSLPA